MAGGAGALESVRVQMRRHMAEPGIGASPAEIANSWVDFAGTFCSCRGILEAGYARCEHKKMRAQEEEQGEEQEEIKSFSHQTYWNVGVVRQQQKQLTCPNAAGSLVDCLRTN